jgi:hypothetical protein
MRIIALVCLIALCPAAVRAQDGDERFEAFAGFSYFRAEGAGHAAGVRGPGFITEPPDTNQRGWIGEFAWRPFRYVSFVGDVSGQYDGRWATSVDFPQGPRPPGTAGITFALNSNERTNLYLGGPRAQVTFGRVTPFAHVMFGAGHRTEERTFTINAFLPGCRDVGCDPGIDPYFRRTVDTSFATAVGGGVDVRIVDGVSLRLVQADYVRTSFQEETQNNARYSTGIVVRF